MDDKGSLSGQNKPIDELVSTYTGVCDFQAKLTDQKVMRLKNLYIWIGIRVNLRKRILVDGKAF